MRTAKTLNRLRRVFGLDTMMSVNRRSFVLSGATITVLGVAAGCVGDDNDDVDDTVEDDVEDDIDDDTDDDIENDLEAHMAEANGYDTVEDYTGETEITIEVGDPEGGANYMFQPAAPEIDSGTHVVWEWIDDASHSVTQTNGDEFDSEIQADYTFEHTFEEPGTYLYICVPHEAVGHIGALVVT